MSVTTETTYDTPAADPKLAADTESPYSVSFKTQRGTLVSVRGRDEAELSDRLASLSTPLPPEGGTVLDMIREIDGALGGAGAASSGGGAPFNGGQQQQQSLNPCPVCGGATQFKEGDNSRGHWKGYFCQVNKDHKPTFIR